MISTDFFPPTFTTPSFDFDSHSKELAELVESFVTYEKVFWKTLAESGYLSEVSDDFKNSSIELIFFKILSRFNLLTTPPLKKRSNSIPSATQQQNVLPIRTSTHKFDPTLSKSQEAFYHYLRGKLFSILPTYNQQSEYDLIRAVKLDPSNLDAWNILGEVFWKKGDFEKSVLCFKGGLEQYRNVVGLVKLAMIYRMAKTTENSLDSKSFSKKILDSVTLCKEAINIDTSCREAWYGLGTSYMRSFFDLSNDIGDLKKSLNAYNRAASIEGDCLNPDLYFNRATIHSYMENYSDCINDLKKSLLLDPVGMGNDTYQSILLYLKHIYSILNVEKLNDFSKTTTKFKLNHLTFQGRSLLSYGANDDAFINVKILRVTTMPHLLYQSFVCVDLVEKVVLGLTMYNVSGYALGVGMELAISKPTICKIELHIKDLEVEFDSIRVENPNLFLVNGKKLKTSDFSYMFTSVEST